MYKRDLPELTTVKGSFSPPHLILSLFISLRAGLYLLQELSYRTARCDCRQQLWRVEKSEVLVLLGLVALIKA
jgi:hypothetical protein